MGEYKKHHIVPFSVLKNFTSSEGKFFYYSKNLASKKIRLRNPSSVFCRNHLYSYLDNDGKKNPDVEKNYFKYLDTNVDPIINQILIAVRRDELPSLDQTQKMIWNDFYIKQMARAPEWLDSEHIQTTLNNTYEISKKRIYEYCSDDNKRLLDDKDFEYRVKSQSRVQALKTRPEIAAGIIKARGLFFVRITNPKKSFIIGSNPLVRFSNRGTGRRDDNNTELWYPIASDVAVSTGNTTEKERLFHLENLHRHTKVIRRLNMQIYKQSTEIGGRSIQLIKSISKDHRVI